MTATNTEKPWIALTIGNSRLHWAWFAGKKLQQSWDTPHLSPVIVEALIANQFNPEIWQQQIQIELQNFLKKNTIELPELWIASVVPQQLNLWKNYPAAHIITLEQIPLKNTYPTLGIDRALAVWGAAEIFGLPVLVIDGGTALTFTGVDTTVQLIGGAILPGLKLQLQSLSNQTAVLPLVETGQNSSSKSFLNLPQRWALNTPAAIQSGVIYTILAGIQDFIRDWRQLFPQSQIIFTGGDAIALHSYLEILNPEMATQIKVDPHLIFWGMRSLVIGNRNTDEHGWLFSLS